MSYKGTDSERWMHLISGNIKIMINDKADEFLEDLFQSPLSRYQIGLKTTMKGFSFIFNHVHLLQQKCHKINLNYGGWYTDSPDWIKNKTQQ